MDKKENTIKYFMKASENEELFTTIAMEECAEKYKDRLIEDAEKRCLNLRQNTKIIEYKDER